MTDLQNSSCSFPARILLVEVYKSLNNIVERLRLVSYLGQAVTSYLLNLQSSYIAHLFSKNTRYTAFLKLGMSPLDISIKSMSSYAERGGFLHPYSKVTESQIPCGRTFRPALNCLGIEIAYAGLSSVFGSIEYVFFPQGSSKNLMLNLNER